MATNLIELAGSFLTSEVMHKIGGELGESPEHVEKAVEAGIPSILAGLLHSVSSSGAKGLVDMLKQPPPELSQVGGLDGILGNLGSILSGSSGAALIKYGQALLTFLFGGKLGAIADVISKTSGMKTSSATSLLGMLAPLLLGLIKKEVAAKGLSPATLTDLVMSQKEAIARYAPAGLSSALGLKSLADLGSVADSRKAGTGAAREFGRTASVAAKEGTSWLRWAAPLALLAVALLGLLYYLNMPQEPAPDRGGAPGIASAARPAIEPQRRDADRASDTISSAKSALTANGKSLVETVSKMVSVSLPGNVKLDVPENSYLRAIVKFLTESNTGEPKSFFADNLNFEGAKSELTSDSSTIMSGIATVLKAFGTAKVKIVAHAEKLGDPTENNKLALARATAVEDALVKVGVPADRIIAESAGSDRPIASSDTEPGRAKSGGIELIIVPK